MQHCDLFDRFLDIHRVLDLHRFKMSESSASTIPPSQERRQCPNCNTRMSSRTFDPHYICIKCRGNVCAYDSRCDVCKSWSDEQMSIYVKHQKALQSKRKSKVKKEPVDFAMACTGAVGSAPPTDELLVGDEVSVSGSSVSGVSQAHVDAIIDQKLEAHNANIDSKLEVFALNLASVLRGEIKDILQQNVQNVPNVSNPPSFPAPQSVPLQQPVEVTETPLRNPHSGAEGLGGDAQGGGTVR